MNLKIGIVTVVLVVVILACFSGIKLSTYRAGWELSTEIVGMKNTQLGNVEKFNIVSAEWDSDFYYAPNHGYPDIKASVGDIREEVPKMAYATLERDFKKFKYIVDYHEYLFDVQIRTHADMIPDGNPEFLDTQQWKHETSMPYEWKTNFAQGGSRTGLNFAGFIYVRFSNLPWGIPDFAPAPENYTFNGYWLGVMNAKIEETDSGIAQYDPPQEIHKGWERNIASVGSQIPMLTDDGTFTQQYAEVPWDTTKVLDPDIKNVVVLELPCDLMAGAWERFNPYANFLAGSIEEAKPVDHYIAYTVRMECLVVKEYEYRDPAASPNPSPIEVPKDYVPYTPYSFWEKYGLIIIGIVIVAIVAIWIFTSISGIGLLQILGVFRFCTGNVKGVKWHCR